MSRCVKRKLCHNIKEILPDELFWEIFLFLDIQNIFNCIISCKKFNLITSNDIFWKFVYKNEFPLTHEKLEGESWKKSLKNSVLIRKGDLLSIGNGLMCVILGFLEEKDQLNFSFVNRYIRRSFYFCDLVNVMFHNLDWYDDEEWERYDEGRRDDYQSLLN